MFLATIHLEWNAAENCAVVISVPIAALLCWAITRLIRPFLTRVWRAHLERSVTAIAIDLDRGLAKLEGAIPERPRGRIGYVQDAEFEVELARWELLVATVRQEQAALINNARTRLEYCRSRARTSGATNQIDRIIYDVMRRYPSLHMAFSSYS